MNYPTYNQMQSGFDVRTGSRSDACLLIILSIRPIFFRRSHPIGGRFDTFSVYSLSDIDYFYSYFQGVTGAARNVKLVDFGLNDAAVLTPFSLYAGGNVSILRATVNSGGIQAYGSSRWITLP